MLIIGNFVLIVELWKMVVVENIKFVLELLDFVFIK